MIRLAIALVGVCLLGGGALAQEATYIPRSSSPTGFRVDNAAASSDSGLSGPAARSGGGAMTGAQGGGGANQSAGHGGAVQLQGNTNINAAGRNVDSTVVGAQNRGCTHVGGIGDCR
jgi:hypothetical protein